MEDPNEPERSQVELDAAGILSEMAIQIDEQVGTIDNNNVVNVESLGPGDIIKEEINKLVSATKNHAKSFIGRASTTAALTAAVHSETFKLVEKMGLVMLKGAREYINIFKDTALITADVLKQDALIGSSTIYDMVLKGIEVAEGVSQKIGYGKSFDEIIKQHETIIYITLQKESLKVLGDDYLSASTSSSDVNAFLDAVLNDNRFADFHNRINAHIIRAAQFFFFSKMGDSAVSNISNLAATMEGTGAMQGVSHTFDNAGVVKQYNMEQIRQRIIALTSGDERKHILSNIISDIHDGKEHNHSKYFGMPYNADDFIANLIGDEGFLTTDLNQKISSVDNSVKYYTENILGKPKKDGSTSTGASITPPGGQLYKRVDKLYGELEEAFDDISEYVDQQYSNKFTDFGGEPADKDTQKTKLDHNIHSRKTQLGERVTAIKDRMKNALSTYQGMDTIDGGSKRHKGRRTRVSKKKKGRKSRHTKRKKGKKSRKHKVSHKKSNHKRRVKRTSRKQRSRK
jgi:hypothetical protein